MKNFQLQNLVSYDGDVYYVSELCGWSFVTIRNNGFEITTNCDKIEDIELSDWLLDKLFLKLNERQWLIETDCDSPFYDYILQKKTKSGKYIILTGDKWSLSFSSIRAFQNMYSLYREYESCNCNNRLNTDINMKLLEIFNLL